MDKNFFWVTIFVSALLIAGCASGPGAYQTTPETPTIPPATVPVTTPELKEYDPMPTPAVAEDALSEIKNRLSELLAIPAEQITLSNMRPSVWTNGCLDLASPGEMCTEALVPGYLITFNTPLGQAIVHTAKDTSYYRVASLPSGDLLAIWERSGGITGACWHMEISRSGSYRVYDCEGHMLSKGFLPEDELKSLSALEKDYAQMEWATEPKPGSADMYNDSFSFFGSGANSPAEAQQKELNAMLAGIFSKIKIDVIPIATPTTEKQ